MPFSIRPMAPDEWSTVADLIHQSTNAWYEAHGRAPVFTCAPADVELFCRTYETLDPGCCLLAVDRDSQQILGSCFYHPRPTHVSLGIMNARPDGFGRGVAKALLAAVIDVAQGQGKPLRLVSSAMNLDSFSLYNRAGMVPFATYQDMVIPVPDGGFPHRPKGADRVAAATPADLPGIVALEREISGIERGQDYAYFLDDAEGIWRLRVLRGEDGGLRGFLASVAAPASNMLGPGVMRDADAAAALIAAELDAHRGRTPVFLVPSEATALTTTLYEWGARNCELHFAQVLGQAQTPAGITMPTFLPETG